MGYIERQLPGFYDGVKTNEPVTLGSTLAVTGAITASGGVVGNVTGNVTGSVTGPLARPTASSAAVGATVVLTAADSGKVLINKSTSGTPSWTLPAKADGLYLTFVCGNTTAGFTVTAADAVIHFKTSASGTVLTSTTTLTNTQGTAIVGDTISIVCDGTAWWMTAISGIFAAS
jgi:hypothetical protein